MTPGVTPLCCGSLVLDANVLLLGEDGRTEVPSTVYLVEGEAVILVDTGFGDPGAVARRHPAYECHRRDDQRLTALLGAAGYDPSDVDAVVLSHLDWDHCHTLAPFDAPVYVQRAELAYAVAPHPIHADRYETERGGDRPWLDANLTAIDGETTLSAGVTAFPTPGHTVGHQSVAVETADGTAVIAADAVATFDALDDDDPARPGMETDEVAWYESARAVVDRADRILPGHDWAILDADPAGLV